MLNSLKMEAFSTPNGHEQPADDNPATPGLSREKMSKLLSRKNRTPTSGTVQQTALPSRGQHLRGDAQRLVEDDIPSVHHEHRHLHVSEETSYLEAEIEHLKAERNVLLEDQARLVAIIQGDNSKMMEVLHVSISLLFSCLCRGHVVSCAYTGSQGIETEISSKDREPRERAYEIEGILRRSHRKQH